MIGAGPDDVVGQGVVHPSVVHGVVHGVVVTPGGVVHDVVVGHGPDVVGASVVPTGGVVCA